MFRRLSQLHFANSRLCFSTTCRRNCFCSSSLEIVSLYVCIKATPRSAQSLTHAKLLTKSRAVLYESFSSHSLTGLSRKLSSMPVVLKKVFEILRSATVWGRDLTKCNPRSALIVDTSCSFSSHDRHVENRQTVNKQNGFLSACQNLVMCYFLTIHMQILHFQ